MAIHIRVEYDERCTHSKRENVQYGSWTETYDSGITDVSVIDENETCTYHSETFKVPDGTEKVFVVYMIYDTGDSFGRAYGKISIMHCTASEEAADKLAKYITEHGDEYTIKYTDDFGREISLYNSGAGYFEHIQYVGVEAFTIGTGGSKRRYYVN